LRPRDSLSPGRKGSKSRFPHQFLERHLQRRRNLNDRIKGDRLLSALDVTDEVHTQVGSFRKLLLSPLAREPLGPDGFAEQFTMFGGAVRHPSRITAYPL